ncbi:unnamed protein product [Bursaphelenchus xylophilus]|uniref:(pine wood nematode) hypothetical protein n=1 Tax=Bursaphelenchus xylophilus TaxID=6326 RepID=A0A1I7SGZ4_BURXY|nr:unnamed protein product [Bursaphelenchus xylophilus]CAG9117295.1 unnamed protein product [Bursaphelenchus xylophilus]
MADVRTQLLNSMDSVHLGVTQADKQAGVDFYKHLFTSAPQVRQYFKGAENYTANDVETSERFHRLGRRLILALHFIASNADHPETIKAYAREQAIFHHGFKMDPALWKAFLDIWIAFLNQKGPVPQATIDAWSKTWPIFAEELVNHDKTL